MDIVVVILLWALIFVFYFLCKKWLLYYSNCVIENEEISKLKNSHKFVNYNRIIKKACLKYYILTILFFIVALFCYFLISYEFSLYINLIFTLPTFLFVFFAFNKLRIVLKLCRCPHCHSRLKCRANIKEVYNLHTVRRFGKMYRFGDIELFYDCKKCGEKLVEEDKKFDLFFLSIFK